jgi:hypothetical protein
LWCGWSCRCFGKGGGHETSRPTYSVTAASPTPKPAK